MKKNIFLAGLLLILCSKTQVIVGNDSEEPMGKLIGLYKQVEQQEQVCLDVLRKKHRNEILKEQRQCGMWGGAIMGGIVGLALDYIVLNYSLNQHATAFEKLVDKKTIGLLLAIPACTIFGSYQILSQESDAAIRIFKRKLAKSEKPFPKSVLRCHDCQ